MRTTVFASVATLSLAMNCCHAEASATLTTLVSFENTNGADPWSGSLVADAAGNLYGTTYRGGAGGLDAGTVFRIEAGTHALTTLATFNGSNGAGPLASLIFDGAGNLYGTTNRGGAGGLDAGTVFRVNTVSHILTTLATFNGSNGAAPDAGVIADASGNLYGTTYFGGMSDLGTVFRIDAATHAVTTLATFNGSNGAGPSAGLIADAAGNLFGTTYGGGAFNAGTVFRLDAGTNALTTLVTFDGASAMAPASGLIADAAGNLYGTTAAGGPLNSGTIFRIKAGTNALTTLVTFNGTNGATPYNSLIADAAGNLYGTTIFGGGTSNWGTVFRLDAGTNVLTTLATFNSSNGAFPNGLIADAAGNLYGTAQLGGAFSYGTVFQLSGTGFVVPEPASCLLAAFCGLGFILFGNLNQRRGRPLYQGRVRPTSDLGTPHNFL